MKTTKEVKEELKTDLLNITEDIKEVLPVELEKEINIQLWSPLQELANHRIDLNEAQRQVKDIIQNTMFKKWVTK